VAQSAGGEPSRPAGAGTSRDAAGTPLDRELVELLEGPAGLHAENGIPLVRLDPQSIEAIATRAAELLAVRRDPATRMPPRLLSAAEVAEWWGVERSWVYAHATQLGARRLGAGERPRLRFDADEVAARLAEFESVRPGSPPGSSCCPPRFRGRAELWSSAPDFGRAAHERPRPRRRRSGLRRVDQPTCPRRRGG
jgi:hypothetical protein